MWKFLYKFSSLKHFYAISGSLIWWVGWLCLVFMITGLYYGLIIAPPDYQQGEGYRILFVHVPAAWMSLFVYVVMATAGAIGLIWKIKLADIIAASSAPIGASFTFLTLATGSLWAKPMWGTWWVWDGRLTSELILLFLYLGIIVLNSAIADKRIAAQASAVLALVGLVNIPIIHYSVQWWTTLHQGSTLSLFKPSSVHVSMLIPWLLMALAFKLYYVLVVLMRARCEILQRERNVTWVQELVNPNC